MKKTHVTYLLLVEVKGLVMFDQLHIPYYTHVSGISLELGYLHIIWSTDFAARMHVWMCLDMSDKVILYLDLWSVSNGIIGDQQSILSINKKQIIVQKNSYLQYILYRHFSYHFWLLRSFDILSRLCSSWVLLEWTSPRREFAAILFMSLLLSLLLLTLLCWRRKVLWPTGVWQE